MGRLFAVMAFAAVARLLGPAPVLAEEPSAIGIIKVRQEVDGAGPSNVFRLQRNIVVLADPLKADIKAYDMETKAAKRSPPAFSPGPRRLPTRSRAARRRARSCRRAADLRSSPKPASIWTKPGSIIPRRRR